MKNLAFAKIGKSIKFKTAYSPIGGDNEAPAIFMALVNQNPDKTFYLTGRSDFSRLTESERIDLFPYDNVIDCYKNSGPIMDKPDYLINYFKDNEIKIDFAIMMMGQIGTVTIPNRVQQIKHPELFASVIDMTKNYSTPIINWLNETDVKWIELINDPRYTKGQSRDFISEPVCSISQYDYEYTHLRMESFENQERFPKQYKASYSGIETAFCIDRKYPNIASIKKNVPFVVVLNEGNPSRYNMLKEWVLDKLDDIETYGKWDNTEAIEDSRFKGPLKLDQVQARVRNARYTFIIPIRKGWVTSKYIEMIHSGCIPFFHPTYDEQQHLDVPDVLRVKSPDDLYQHIDYFEKHPDKRIELLEQLQASILKECYYDGTYINNLIMNLIAHYTDQVYNSVDVTQYEKKEVHTLF